MEKIKEKGRKDMAYQQAWKEMEAALPKEQWMDRKVRNVLEIQDELLYRKRHTLGARRAGTGNSEIRA